MIIILYREEIRKVIAGLPPDSVESFHFRFILKKMEQGELQAVSVSEHGG